MKANELRIGNYLHLKRDSDDSLEIVTVVELNNDHIYATGDEVYPYLEDSLEPIPLTEEWLQKFGFTHTKYGGTYLYECFELSIKSEYNQASIVGHKTKDEPLKCYFEDIDSQKIGNEIQYVHTLQNLYFVLTGNELQIK